MYWNSNSNENNGQSLELSQVQEKQMHNILDEGLNELKNSTTKKHQKFNPSLDYRNCSPIRVSNNISGFQFTN
jgi:hypothetical protein